MSDVNRDDLRQDWVDHPYASIARRRLDDLIAAAKSNLNAACSTSTDPKVRGAYDRVKALESAIDIVSKGVT
jgi:hypothetical protein